MENTKDKTLAENEAKIYMEQLSIANLRVEKYLENNPEYDKADLFRIAMNSFKTPDELLASGLRRRVIGGN